MLIEADLLPKTYHLIFCDSISLRFRNRNGNHTVINYDSGSDKAKLNGSYGSGSSSATLPESKKRN